MVTRRKFLLAATATALTIPRAKALVAGQASKLSAKQRIDRVLQGADVDRPPYSFWHHFGLEKQPSGAHAKATLEFYRKFKPDLVKVMSDYAYPKAIGAWYALREEKNPFPEQIKALEEIRRGLNGQAYFVETIFNSWNVAVKLASPEAVRQLKEEKPQQLLDALEVITKSQANHARLAMKTGAAGIFLAIANAEDGVLSPADYAKFSEPFDKMVLDAVHSAPLNILHLHGDKVYLERFYKGWPAAINYSVHGTGVSFADVRRKYSGVLMGGIDERSYRKLTADELKQQSSAAAKEAGAKFILAPGCSVPDESTDAELQKLPRYLSAEC